MDEEISLLERQRALLQFQFHCHKHSEMGRQHSPQPLPIGIGSTHNCVILAGTASGPWNTATVTVFCFHVVAVNISQLLSFQLNLFSWLAFLDVAMYAERPIFRETGIAFGQWNTKSIRLTDSGPGTRSLGWLMDSGTDVSSLEPSNEAPTLVET